MSEYTPGDIYRDGSHLCLITSSELDDEGYLPILDFQYEPNGIKPKDLGEFIGNMEAFPDLLEACRTFTEWLRREDEGFRGQRDTPHGEREFGKWFKENVRICDLAVKQARAAIAKATPTNKADTR